MSDVVIRVEELSKQYRLGTVGTGTLQHDLNRFWHRIRGKEDPYLKIGQVNDRTKKSTSEYVWALKDINFEVKQGEVLGIIGRNGAGKSTLLKILSKITAPTKGQVKVKGRIASLLEVGTGFHAELSGRENIFLNGAVLGMRKEEIRKKFDEMVDFAGVEAFIDTPVKRYSSGMYIRLAFSIAAFLDPDILIIDEVLAVGDAEFQRKALGRMSEVSASKQRTVLFVSHNMAAISQICQTSLLLDNGCTTFIGPIHEAINRYTLQNLKQETREYENPNTLSSDESEILKVWLTTTYPNNLQRHGTALKIHVSLHGPKGLDNPDLSFQIIDVIKDIPVVYGWIHSKEQFIGSNPGIYDLVCEIPQLKLYHGKYNLTIHYSECRGIKNPKKLEKICPFTVSMAGITHSYEWSENNCVYIENTNWKINYRDSLR